MLLPQFPRLIIATLVVAITPSIVAFAETPQAKITTSATLKVGSVAPALTPKQWLQGEPVTGWDKDKTYVVEFWATWCGPCVGAIPHVNALHSKFKDKGLVVIGVDVQEDDIKIPTAFLKKQGDAMAYRVAFDGQSRRVDKQWLGAAHAGWIPHTFVVHDGKIIWQGYPTDLKDSTVELILAGKFDAAQAHKELFLRDNKNLAEPMTREEEAARFDRSTVAMIKVLKLEEAKRFDEALAVLEEFERTPGAARSSGFIIGSRMRYLFEKGGPGLGKTIIDLANEQPCYELMVADALLNAPELKDSRDPKSAKVFISRFLARKPEFSGALLLDAQADYALGNKSGAEKTLTALAGTAPRENDGNAFDKVRTALEAVKAGKEWPR